MITDPTRSAIETVLTVRDHMENLAQLAVAELIGDIVDQVCHDIDAAYLIDRADRWSMATHAVFVVVMKHLSQQEPKR